VTAALVCLRQVAYQHAAAAHTWTYAACADTATLHTLVCTHCSSSLHMLSYTPLLVLLVTAVCYRLQHREVAQSDIFSNIQCIHACSTGLAACFLLCSMLFTRCKSQFVQPKCQVFPALEQPAETERSCGSLQSDSDPAVVCVSCSSVVQCMH
jgi:hypothetical protein